MTVTRSGRPRAWTEGAHPDHGASLTPTSTAAVTTDIGAKTQECIDVNVYVAIDNTAAAPLPAGWNTETASVVGTGGAAGDIRFSEPATSFTAGVAKTVPFGAPRVPPTSFPGGLPREVYRQFRLTTPWRQ